jgi:hypothetical protein
MHIGIGPDHFDPRKRSTVRRIWLLAQGWSPIARPIRVNPHGSVGPAKRYRSAFGCLFLEAILPHHKGLIDCGRESCGAVFPILNCVAGHSETFGDLALRKTIPLASLSKFNWRHIQILGVGGILIPKKLVLQVNYFGIIVTAADLFLLCSYESRGLAPFDPS